MEKQLIFNTYKDAVAALKKHLNSRNVNLDCRHIVICPERYSLFMEKYLYSGGGAFDIQVLTLSRLAQKIIPGPYLIKAGGVMLMRKIIDENANALEYFKGAHKFNGFAQKMYETVLAFKGSLISPEQISANSPALEKKFKDIRLLYNKYCEHAKNEFIDSAARLELLADNIFGNKFIKNAEIHLINFADTQDLQNRVFNALKANAKSFRYYQVQGKEYVSLNNPLIYAAPDRITEFKAAAAHIRDYIFRGGHYDDIAVLCNDNHSAIKRIFDEYNIPYYIETRVNLFEHPLCEFINLLYHIKNSGLKRNLVIRLAKNFFSPLESSTAETFEDYCTLYAVDYNDFLHSFECPQNEKTRIILINLINSFCAEDNFVNAVLKLLKGCIQKSDELNSISKYPVAALNKIEQIIELIQKVYFAAEYELCAKMFFDAARSINISVLPNLTNTIQITSPEGVRGQDIKFLLVTGCNESVMPSCFNENNLLLNPQELDENNLTLNCTDAQKNARARLDLADALACAKKVFISFTTADKISVFINAQIQNYDIIDLQSRELSMRSAADEDLIAAYCSSKANTLEILAKNLNNDWDNSAFKALGGDVQLLQKPPSPKCGLKYNLIKRNSVGCTQLQTYFDCPYKHFLRYGLNILPKKTAEFLPPDSGEILHNIAKEFVEKGDLNYSYEAVSLLVDKFIQKHKFLAKNAFKDVRMRLYHDAVEICATAALQIQAGDMVAKYFEIGFGNNETLPPLRLRNSNIILSGKIDRVDIFDNLARVIDYKTGRAEFSVSQLFYGRKLQLPLYSLVINNAGYQCAGMFYLVFSPGVLNEHSRQLSGIYLKDPKVVYAMDRSLEQGGKSAFINCTTVLKNGKTDFHHALSCAYSKREFDSLCNYALNLAQNAVDEINQGFIAQKPYRDSKSDACKRCDYFGFCQDPQFRQLDSVSKQSIVREAGDE